MADRYLLEDGSGVYELEDGSGGYLLESPEPAPNRPLYADGHAGVLKLGAAIGSAMLWGSMALFAPTQPKPQHDMVQGGTQRLEAAAQWSGRIFGVSAPLPPQSIPQTPWYGNSRAPEQLSRSWISTGDALFSAGVVVPAVPLTPALLAAPQILPHVPAVVFNQAPAPRPTPALKGVLAASPQADPTQTSARVSGTLPQQKPPLDGVLISVGQVDPSQPSAVLFRQPPLTALAPQAPALHGVLVAISQSPELIQGANWADPSTFAPAQPRPQPAFRSSMRDARAFEGAAHLFGQTLLPPPPTMPGADALPPLIQQGAESQPPRSWIVNAYPFPGFVAPQPEPQTDSRSSMREPRAFEGFARLFGQFIATPALPGPALRGVLVASPQADPTQIQPRLAGTRPLPPVPFTGVLLAPPQADPSQARAVVFRQPPLTDTPYSRMVIAPPQADPSQPAAIAFRQPPGTDTPFDRTVFGAPQTDPSQARAVLFGTQPPSVFPPPLGGVVLAVQQADPTQIQPLLLKPAVHLPSIDLCPILLAEAYARIAELEAELAAALANAGTGGYGGGGGDDHHHHHPRDDNHAEQEAILQRHREAKRRRIDANNAFIMALAGATVHGLKRKKDPK